MKLFLLAAALAIPALFISCAANTVESPSSGGSGGTGGPGGGGGPASSSSSSSSSSSGIPGKCTMASECKAFDDACNVGTCINGTCGKTPANNGGGCDDGLFCTDNDACQNGLCVGGTAKVCPSPDSCHLGTCDETLKACKGIPGNDGAQCDDDDACTLKGNCSAGACIPGGPVDCSFLDGTCSVGYCDPAIGCKVMPVNDGTACNDNLFCTVLDVCTAGQCMGQPNNCAQPGNICMIGTCNEAQKTCTAVPGNDGVMCDDGNLCTSGSTCSAGNCIGGVPANNGMVCDDANACTNGTHCNNGVCGGAQMVVNQCIDGDGCCPANCQMNDSDCSITKWSEGTQNWPDQACNPQFSFGGCNTNAQDHADAWATAVCQLNGYSSGIWTGNKMGGCNGPISMWCGGVIPCQQIYENSCSPSDQTKIEFTCFP